MNAKTLAGNKSTSPRRLLGIQELIQEQQHWSSLHKTSKSSYANGQRQTQKQKLKQRPKKTKPLLTQNQGEPLRQTAQAKTYTNPQSTYERRAVQGLLQMPLWVDRNRWHPETERAEERVTLHWRGNSTVSMRKKVGINRRRRLTTARHNLLLLAEEQKADLSTRAQPEQKTEGCGTRPPGETHSFRRSWEEGSHRAHTAKLWPLGGNADGKTLQTRRQTIASQPPLCSLHRFAEM